MKVALIGGTGKLGQGFAARLVQTGHEVAIGSRSAEKARAAATEVEGHVEGMSNGDAAKWCEAALLSIPYEGRRALLEPLAADLGGKIVIDSTVPIDPRNVLQVRTETGTSAAQETAEIIPGADVFAAFQTVSHRVLLHPEVSHDVLVAGSADRKGVVLDLIRGMGLRPVDAGPLEVAGLLERMTVLLISINKQNKTRESGIHISGLPG